MRVETIEDRVNYMRDIFQTAMKSFEGNTSKFNDLMAEFEKFSPLLANLTKSHADLGAVVTKLIDSTTSSLSNTSNQQQNIYKNISDLKTEQDYAKKYYQELQSIIGTLKADIAKLFNSQSGFVSVAALADVKSAIKDVDDNAGKAFKGVEQLVAVLMNKHYGLSHVVDDLKSDITAMKPQIRANNDLPQQVAANTQDILGKLNSGLNDVRQFTKDHVASQPKPVIPSLDDAKKAMQSQLEPMSKNAQNANDRSLKNEIRIMLLKKKYEALELLLKKSQPTG